MAISAQPLLIGVDVSKATLAICLGPDEPPRPSTTIAKASPAGSPACQPDRSASPPKPPILFTSTSSTWLIRLAIPSISSMAIA